MVSGDARLAIAWVVYFIVLLVLWVLREEKIKGDGLRKVTLLVLLLLTAVSLFIFFATCLGIGYAGCM